MHTLPWYTRLLRKYSNLNGEGYLTLQPSLYGKVLRTDPSRLAPEQKVRLRHLLTQNIDVGTLAGPFHGEVLDCGLLSTRMVTNTGVLLLCAAFANAANIANFKYHGFGTSSTAEAVTQTGLITEAVSGYAVNGVRPTGTQSNTVAMPAVYSTVATFAPATGGNWTITEHGIFAGASGANTMWDRSVFTGVQVTAPTDTLQVTYNLTLVAGG